MHGTIERSKAVKSSINRSEAAPAQLTRGSVTIRRQVYDQPRAINQW